MDFIITIKKDKNEVVEELFSIYKKSGTTVDYSTTVFKSDKQYNINNGIGSEIYENTKKKVWNTSLEFEPGNDIFYKSAKDKGVDFGWLMLDYISKKPQLCIVVKFDGNNTYTYKSATFDKESKSFVNSQNESVTTTTLKELADFITVKFNLDLDKYPLISVKNNTVKND